MSSKVVVVEKVDCKEQETRQGDECLGGDCEHPDKW